MLVTILVQLVSVAGKVDSEDVCDVRSLSEFNVMSMEWGICLSSTRIDEKSNEIPEMQDVMDKLDCRGCVVTADAINTQKETARAIVEKAHGDYCLALKENHKTAYYEVKEYFANEGLLKEIMAAAGQYLKETEETASETVIREYFITSDIKWFQDRKDWEKICSIGYEKKQSPENKRKISS
ncbi:MAG: ISAs1 family transposase [Lachnospiraceae bacterium]|nr:ISAs1 family transposase [Lachnospiraceae bacterium]